MSCHYHLCKVDSALASSSMMPAHHSVNCACAGHVEAYRIFYISSWTYQPLAATAKMSAADRTERPRAVHARVVLRIERVHYVNSAYVGLAAMPAHHSLRYSFARHEEIIFVRPHASVRLQEALPSLSMPLTTAQCLRAFM